MGVASLLVALPLVAFAQVSNESFGRQIVNQVFARLCAAGVLKGSRCQQTPQPMATLTLIKTVINDNGGTATTTTFQGRIDGTNVPWNAAQTLLPGLHTASEVATSTYSASSWGGDCAADGTIILTPGDNKTCTITNDDQAGRLIVDKVTVPSGSGAVFSLMATGTGSIMGGGSGTTTDAVSKEYTVSAGTYSVEEAALAGWVQASSTCTNVVVGVGETKTCTITNHQLPKLTVTKIVVNDSGGVGTTTDFALFVNGATTTSGVQNSYVAGTTTVSEGAHAGYASMIGGDCAADGSVMLSIGDVKICTVTNDDIAQASTTGHLIVDKVTQPSGSSVEFDIMATGTGAIMGGGSGMVTDATSTNYEVTPGTYSVTEATSSEWMIVSNTCTDIVVAAGETETCTITNAKLPTLIVTKMIVNNDGGTGTTTDFTLMIDGATTTSGVAMTVATGTHTVSEGAHAGYTSSISGDCLLNGNITLAAGDNKTCIITNDDEEVTGQVMISEVYYDVASTTVTGTDSLFEWVEIYNGTNGAVDLQGWWIGDETSVDMISSSFVIPSGSLAIIAASTTPSGIPGGVPVFVLHSSIGNNGFSNEGDAARLFNIASTSIDMVGFGDNSSVSPNVTIPGAGLHDGHSIMRVQLTSDTDTAADWADTDAPTPGS